MTAFNVVRFKVKPGSEQQFLEEHRKARPGFKGFLGASLIKTGDQTFCFVGEWRNFDSIVKARPQMISMLDGMRDLLEDLGGGLGVTDPISGQAVVKIAPPKPAKKRLAKPRRATKRAKAKRPAKKRKR
jgi:Antibiotic biosynthesis monooxygenase